jgi:hypothetical protein
LGGAQGFHVKLSNRPDMVARLARGDVNMPNYDGFPIHVQVPEVKFEVAVNKLLRSEPNIFAFPPALPSYPRKVVQVLLTNGADVNAHLHFRELT